MWTYRLTRCVKRNTLCPPLSRCPSWVITAQSVATRQYSNVCIARLESRWQSQLYIESPISDEKNGRASFDGDLPGGFMKMPWLSLRSIFQISVMIWWIFLHHWPRSEPGRADTNLIIEGGGNEACDWEIDRRYTSKGLTCMYVVRAPWWMYDVVYTPR